MKLFIPIKHNSQRVPGKNFRDFGGMPLYQHCLKRFAAYEKYVDTDSDEILAALKDIPGVTAYRRLPEQEGDEVSVCDLILRFVQGYCEPEDVVCQIHVTSPFLKPLTLDRAFEHMGEHDSVSGCNIVQSRFWRHEEYGFCPVNHNPMKLEQTQDLPELYEENSAFYMFLADVVMHTGNRIGKNPHFLSVGWPENLDIDTEVEMRAALALRKMMEEEK